MRNPRVVSNTLCPRENVNKLQSGERLRSCADRCANELFTWDECFKFGHPNAFGTFSYLRAFRSTCWSAGASVQFASARNRSQSLGIVQNCVGKACVIYEPESALRAAARTARSFESWAFKFLRTSKWIRFTLCHFVSYLDSEKVRKLKNEWWT